jgi:hypothetical protein
MILRLASNQLIPVLSLSTSSLRNALSENIKDSAKCVSPIIFEINQL